jgi:DNA-binding CsgD family transcriptional regulator
MPRARRPPDTAISLTTREMEVLRLIAVGCTYAETGRRLGVSAHTIASHIKKTYRKLGAHSATAAVHRAKQLGIL